MISMTNRAGTSMNPDEQQCSMDFSALNASELGAIEGGIAPVNGHLLVVIAIIAILIG